jgi:hypothetical protein
MPKPSSGLNNKNKFEQAGFTKSAGEVKRRLILAIDGQEKSGKTHFALSAPEPIGVINFDVGLDGVVQKWHNDKDVWVQDVRFVISDYRQMKPEEASREADRILQKVWDAYEAILGYAKTIVIDNATELWELVRLSHFGKLEQVKPHHYVHPNNEYREFIRMAYDQDITNLILLHKVKDEYVENERTGAKKRAGFSDTGFLVQCNALCYRNMQEPNVPDCFHMTITDCRQNAELAGIDLSGNDLNFPSLAVQVFPNTKEEDWL